MTPCPHCKGRPLADVFMERERARTPVERLAAAPEEANPALVMAWRLQQRALTRAWGIEELIELAPAIAEAEKAGAEAAASLRGVRTTLVGAVALPSRSVPEGL